MKRLVKHKKKQTKFLGKKINNKGSTDGGTVYVVAILVGVAVLGYTLIGGQFLSPNANTSGQQVLIVTPTPQNAQTNLQLYTFLGETLTPAPSYSCTLAQGDLYDTESEIMQGTDPGPGGIALSAGTIRAWVKDEAPPFISPNEKVNSTTGAITPGNRSALDTGTDGKGDFYWEPTLYFVPPNAQLNANHVYCDAKIPGCSAIFPNEVKGDYNTANGGTGYKGPPIDSDAGFLNGPNPNGSNPNGNKSDKYYAEYIWNVGGFNLTPGSYTAQIVVHDGDTNLSVDCIAMTIN
jgi:hypothetical protein